MIKLQNVCKTYSTKSKGNVYALQDVNLTFPSTGLCIVLGPSGCGKTTLLNILGGLDSAFEGEYYFGDKKLSKEKDFADFRKNYVSFVFQDFNLIEDLDVKENLSLGVSFGKADPSAAIENVLKKVDLEDYDYRFPQELSGGEQQRVAIARALLKESKIVLADEPTGNLDVENSEEAYKLLKDISRDKLVIVVSHDENLSKRFADFSVRLDDGKVVQNDIPANDAEAVTLRDSKGKAISNKIASQMAWYEFTRKKIRSIVTVLVLILCLTVVSVTVPYFQYDGAVPRAQFIKDSQFTRFLIEGINYHKLQDMQEKGVEYAIASESGDLTFTSRAEAEKNGIKFYESEKNQELAPNNYYISDGLLRELFYSGDFNGRALIDGEEVTLNFGEYQFTDVIGQRLYKIGYDKICAGIFYSPYEVTNGTLQNTEDYDPVANYENDFYSGIITCYATGKSRLDQYVHVKQNGQDVSLTASCRVENSFNVSSGNALYIIDSQGNLTQKTSGQDTDSSSILNEGEMYVNLAAYNKIFKTSYNADDIFKMAFAGEAPDYLGTEAELEIVNYLRGTVNIGKFVIKGVVLSEGYGRPNGNCTLYVGGKQAATECSLQLNEFNAWITVSSVSDLPRFLRECRDTYKTASVTPADDMLKGFEKNIIPAVIDVAKVVAVVIGVLTIGLTAALIVGQVLSRKREIGIFKALGAKNVDISKIYAFEALIIATPISIFATVLSGVLNKVQNVLLSKGYEFSITWIMYNWTNAPFIVVATFALVLLGVLVPMIFINKISVIDAIRQGK